MLGVCNNVGLEKPFGLQYYARCGQTVWLFLYQDDVRARLEQVERVRRRGHAAGAVGPPSEFEDPALLLLSRAIKLNTLIDGGAAVQQSGAGVADAP